MRRLIGLLSILTLANLTVVQVGAACSLARGVKQTAGMAAPAAEHAGHDGHAMSAPESVEVAQPGSHTSPTHAPGCLTMSQCAIIIDVTRLGPVASIAGHPSIVVGASDQRPASLASTPELPPPRA